MITLFRVNSFIQIFSLLLVLLLLKVPFMMGGLPLLRPELEWMLLGERLDGGSSLYSGVWTDSGPLAAYVYSFIHALFGRNQLYYEMFALVLVYFQALYFTLIVNNNRLTLERNYLPGLFYVLVMSLSFDLVKISPALMALSFLLLALNSLFKQIENKEEGSEHVFEIGLHLGIGSLFWYSLPLFAIWALLSLLMFTPLKFKQFLLFILGFFLPQVVAVLFYYFKGTFTEYYAEWILKGMGLSPLEHLNFAIPATVFGFPILLAVFGIFKVMGGTRYNNFQNRKHQVLILSGIFGLVAYFFGNDNATYQMLGMVPFLAFFSMGLFIHMKGAYGPELLFIGVLAVFICINAAGLNRLFGTGFNHLKELRVDQANVKTYVKNKRILVTGDVNDDYLFAQSTTKYLNWQLSEKELSSADTYEGLAAIHESFQEELPEYIIDNAQVFPEIFRRIPAMARVYDRVEGTRHYRLKEEAARPQP